MELWLSFWERRYGVLAENSPVLAGRCFACDFVVSSHQLRVDVGDSWGNYRFPFLV
jgi:hypothetical protein